MEFDFKCFMNVLADEKTTIDSLQLNKRKKFEFHPVRINGRGISFICNSPMTLLIDKSPHPVVDDTKRLVFEVISTSDQKQWETLDQFLSKALCPSNDYKWYPSYDSTTHRLRCRSHLSPRVFTNTHIQSGFFTIENCWVNHREQTYGVRFVVWDMFVTISDEDLSRCLDDTVSTHKSI